MQESFYTFFFVKVKAEVSHGMDAHCEAVEGE